MVTQPKWQVRTREFRSWYEFKDSLIRELFCGKPFSRGRFLFRGHRSTEWTLKPRFDRLFGDKALALALLEAFRNECEARDLADLRIQGDNAWLALGQHYGLPTRLLDWSYSPYIAAFFAFNDALTCGEGTEMVAVWILDSSWPIWGPDHGVEILKVPAIGNARLRNQEGCFTLSKTPFSTLEEFVAHCNPDGKNGIFPLQECFIPASDTQCALADLDAMGINHATAYPDLSGAAISAMVKTMIRTGDHR